MRKKRTFTMKWKASFIIFEGLSFSEKIKNSWQALNFNINVIFAKIKNTVWKWVIFCAKLTYSHNSKTSSVGENCFFVILRSKKGVFILSLREPARFFPRKIPFVLLSAKINPIKIIPFVILWTFRFLLIFRNTSKVCKN